MTIPLPPLVTGRNPEHLGAAVKAYGDARAAEALDVDKEKIIEILDTHFACVDDAYIGRAADAIVALLKGTT